MQKGRVGRVINDCGTQDSSPACSQILSVGTGCAGRLAFFGMLGQQVVNRYFEGSHSLYFERDGKPDDQFMEKHWLPLILRPGCIDDEAQRVDQRRAPSVISGAAAWLVQHADSMKLATVGVALAWGIYYGLLEPRIVSRKQEVSALDVRPAKSAAS